MEYRLVLKPIDENDPRYKDYLKTTENPSNMGFEYYCADLYEKEINQSLLKHANRNEEFLKKVNHFETFVWIQEYTINRPKSMWKDLMGKELFKAHCVISGCYNSLMAQLSLGELDEELIVYFLNRIIEHRKVIEP